jgi:hypothetical protein
MWTIHGLIKEDLVIILAQSTGIATSAIILIQMKIYKTTNENKNKNNK